MLSGLSMYDFFVRLTYKQNKAELEFDMSIDKLKALRSSGLCENRFQADGGDISPVDISEDGVVTA